MAQMTHAECIIHAIKLMLNSRPLKEASCSREEVYLP